jgi:uncharacterized membrane protein
MRVFPPRLSKGAIFMIKVKSLAKIAIVASIYVVLTLAIAPLSYGDLQLRFSEILLLLCFYNPEYGISMIIGCFLANLASPLGWYDWVLGTGQTVVSVALIIAARKIKLPLWCASLSAIIGCPLIGWELNMVFGLPFIASTLWVMLGEFIVVSLLGTALFKSIEKTKFFKYLM